MKIKILKTTVANKEFVRAGAIIDVSEADAKLLIGIHKAEAVGDEEVQQTEEIVEQSDEVVEEGDELTTENTEAVVATAKPKRGKK